MLSFLSTRMGLAATVFAAIMLTMVDASSRPMEPVETEFEVTRQIPASSPLELNDSAIQAAVAEVGRLVAANPRTTLEQLRDSLLGSYPDVELQQDPPDYTLVWDPMTGTWKVICFERGRLILDQSANPVLVNQQIRRVI